MALESNRVGVRSDQVDTFGRVTSPSFLNELLDCLPEWTDMPVYKGGTEEILPSNTAVPTTSPIVADIKYPDGMRQNQVFTYRETPAEVDGLAKIKSIKGNTLVWNQLVQNGNFVDTSNWAPNNVTLTASNNVLDVKCAKVGSASYSNIIQHGLPFVKGHKYLYSYDINPLRSKDVRIYFIATAGSGGSNLQRTASVTAGVWNTFAGIIEMPTDIPYDNFQIAFNMMSATGYEVDDIDKVRNCKIFDLTQMFGSGNEPATVEEFTALFPLPYYAYNTGTLLSFTGTGIKSTTKNLVYKILEKVNISSSGELITDGQELYDIAVAQVVAGNTYIITPHATAQVMGYFTTDPVVGSRTYNNTRITDGVDIFTAEITGYMVFRLERTKYVYAQLEIGTTRTSYGENDSSTTDLPKTDYYPSGLKSAGSVYDELTPRKAEIRVGTVDLGSLNWIHRSEILEGLFSVNVTNTVLYKFSNTTQFMSARYDSGGVVTAALLAKDKPDKTLCIYYTPESTDRYIYIKDTSFNNANTLKQALSGVYLNYELATPVELPTIEFE